MQNKTLQMKRALRTALLVLLLGAMGIANAQVSVWDGTWEPWTHGTGTEADPFLIENAQQLAYLAYRVNNGLDAGGGHVSNHDYHYKLMVDVNLNGSEDFQWTPIGYWNTETDYQCFGGHFDGNEHTISRLYIKSSANRVGLFGYVNGATIEKLGISGDTIETTSSYAGGIVGAGDGTIVITNCYNMASISSNSSASTAYSGGIIGYASSATIANCYNTGSVSVYYWTSASTGSSVNSGGVLGFANSSVTISSCYNTGNVSSICSSLSWDYARSGGILGCAPIANITNCYNTGTISTESPEYSYCGGVMGQSSNSVTITNCYNSGSASSISPNYNYAYSGGVLGVGTSINITNSYNVGATTSTNFNGGLVGYKTNGIATNSYYLSTCGGNNTYGGQPMSADAMQSAEFVTILNAGTLTYKKDERPYINQGYPIFSGFNIETQPASNVDITSAVLNGNYTSGIFNITSQGFEYKKTTDQNYTTVNCTVGQTPFSYELNGLESGATYQYRAFAVANEGTAYGELVEFTTATVNTHQIYIAVYDFSSGPGFVSPSGRIDVVDGEDLTIEISPIERSILDSVRVDGMNIGIVNSYTFRNVTEDHYLHAHFSLISTPDYEPWDGTTINEPFHYDNYYYICSPKELAWVAQTTNNSNLLSDKTICLMNSIDLGGTQLVQWTPIGTPSHPFRGAFYGHGKSIYNLYCNNTGSDNIGLFGYAEESRISHTQLRNANVEGRTNVGGFIGYSKNTSMAYCNVTGQIHGINNAGGLVGTVENIQPYNQGIFWGCYASVEIEADENAGGLYGLIQGNSAYSCFMEKSFSTGIVQSQNHGCPVKTDQKFFEIIEN